MWRIWSNINLNNRISVLFYLIPELFVPANIDPVNVFLLVLNQNLSTVQGINIAGIKSSKTNIDASFSYIKTFSKTRGSVVLLF
jgi:hypothetical protein